MQPSLLMQEVRDICFGPGWVQSKWLQLAECPACVGPHLDYAFSKYEFAHVRCRDCGLVSLKHTPPDEVLNALYAGSYYTQVRELFELRRLTDTQGMTPLSAPEAVLGGLVERASQGQRSGAWLDAGGGFGSFALFVNNKLPEWDVLLNDLNPRSLEIARDVLGLRTTDATSEALALEDMRFDVVSAISVLEHMPYPSRFLASYARLLKPGGRFILVTPNLTPLSSLVAKASCPAVTPPFHINLFNERSLQKLIERSAVFDSWEILDAGPPAFSLTQHIEFSEYFDISIPTPADPEPRTVMLKTFPEHMSERINALAALQPLMADHFAKTDGRTYLIAVAKTRF